jgi:hypothetical protein
MLDWVTGFLCGLLGFGDAAAITAVAAQPQIAIDRDSVSRPMTLGLRTINIITAISGAASTPLTTAAHPHGQEQIHTCVSDWH